MAVKSPMRDVSNVEKHNFHTYLYFTGSNWGDAHLGKCIIISIYYICVIIGRYFCFII